MAAGVDASRGDAALSSTQLLLAAAWTGALWTVGALVAPGLFAALPDRVLAGTLAGALLHGGGLARAGRRAPRSS
jgi:hypothetical protein